MQNGSKYVPPHLRNAQGGGGSSSSGGGGGQAGYGGSRSSYGGDRGGDRGADRGGDRGGDRGSYRGGGGGGAPQPSNSRWNNVGGDGDGGGYGGSRGGYGGGGGGNYGGRGQARVNERGFHGDMRLDPRQERQLFNREQEQGTGINFDKYDKIPVETSGGDCPEPVEEYTIDTIGEDLMRNTQLCGYARPTPVQKYSIPIGLADKDLMACAQTGSGKTAGFLFPIILSMLRRGGSPPPENAGGRRCYPHALVLSPTRELTMQIHEEAKRFTYATGIAAVVVYGGADIRDQLRQIERGCDMIIATPGRLVDLIERGRVSMEGIKFLVLDEADRMLDMGFEPQIRRIVEQEGMPFGDDRQSMMFSATFPANIQRLAGDFMREYIFLTVGRVGSASKDVTQTVEYVEDRDKLETLMRFLLTVEEGLILIFVETKRSCDYLEDVLCSKGFPACSIHGDKSQREREDSLRSFKRGNTPVMCATDVASRGLDIPNVTQVVNYDLPNTIDDYVHRIGRTGRAGNTGAALAFVNEKNGNITRELREMLEENDQECPKWLSQMGGFGGGGGGRGRGGGRRGGGSSFGGRDYRRDGGGGGGGGSGGGGYGGGGYGGKFLFFLSL